MDIRFYDFDLNLLYILPPKTENNGYISINATREFCGSGSIEIELVDNELQKIIQQNRDRIIITWGKVQGFITGYTHKGSKLHLFGMTLNGLLHRVCIPPVTYSGAQSIKSNAELLISNYVSWLTVEASGDIFPKVTNFKTEEYRYLDEVMDELLKDQNCGYLVYADLSEKIFYFKCLLSKESEQILSKNNLNAYDVEVTYSNKPMAFSGWYQKEQEDADPVWTKITSDSTKTGIDAVCVILSATNEAEAQKELRSKVREYTITAKTKNITFEQDYFLGDIVRVQKDKETERKLVESVDLWSESTTHGEEPKLTELKEV